MALIRDEREREKRRRPGTVPARRRCHGCGEKARRPMRIKVYGPRFDEPVAQEVSGDEGESILGPSAAGGRGRQGGRHGRRREGPWRT